jgi:hypothetical protein
LFCKAHANQVNSYHVLLSKAVKYFAQEFNAAEVRELVLMAQLIQLKREA